MVGANFNHPNDKSSQDDSDDDNMPLADLKESKKRGRESDGSDEEFTLDEDKKKKKEKKKHKKKDKKKDKKHKHKEKHHKKEKKQHKSASSRKAAPSKPRASKPATREIKMITKMERYEQAMKAFKWWEQDELPPGVQNGVNFTPDYIPHNVKLYYDDEPVDLTPEQEEVATFYASMPVDGPQLGNPKTAKVFNANFFGDFKKYLGRGHKIQKFDKLDFSRIRQHLDREKMIRKAATIEEKAAKKASEEQLVFKHGFALVDGNMQKLANFRMEPPSLFRGRGEHPKTGKVKTRTLPESVTLNIGPDACPPKCPLPGHTFAAIVHKPEVTWLAQWNENVLDQNKYVQLAASSSFKGKSDRNKYGKAIKLLHSIEKIRKDYTKNLKAKDLQAKQIATAMWIIDILALRVGGEKGDDEADTVGCCSLRVEHFTINDDEDTYEMDLEFLGKDSMLFKQTICFAKYDDVGKKVYTNIKSFIGKKKSNQDVFDKLTPPILNAHLSGIMPGLSAKVFRTYNASYTLEKELPDEEQLEGMSVADKVVAYNAANRKVAILCNHQKTVSKGAIEGLESMNELFENLKQQRAELVKMKARIDSGKQLKKLKEESDQSEKAKAAVEKAKEMTAKATTSDEKIAATQQKEKANEMRKAAGKAAKEVAHLFTRQPTSEQVSKRIEGWDNKIKKLEVTIRNKDENKEVALGTSKINYMDPRISVAWCKRNEVPIDKIFAKALRDKFPWAMAVPPDWEFQ